jgi:hypothetical protein
MIFDRIYESAFDALSPKFTDLYAMRHDPSYKKPYEEILDDADNKRDVSSLIKIEHPKPNKNLFKPL